MINTKVDDVFETMDELSEEVIEMYEVQATKDDGLRVDNGSSTIFMKDATKVTESDHTYTIINEDIRLILWKDTKILQLGERFPMEDE